jgi:eukaryotic-like serine/threonine-protein kinase
MEMEGRIGKYEIQAELGRGGFGRVYRAYDPSMGRPVAIKVVTSDGEPDLLTRFRAEAGVHGKLHHKNIVTIYEFGEQNGAPYIVMELLEGENLQSVLQTRRNLSLLEKMRIMCQTAEGLYYAHQSGVVHRDVKPANIMLLPSGLIKIMDFGIARLVDGATSRRTSNGDLIGTTLYMSPEQFRGSDADIQSDIFAYGVIYYELLSGVHPFQAAEVSAIIYRIMSVDPLPLREVAPECPEALEVLVHRALAKDRTRRYPGLDDALLDAEPIILELRRDEASSLMKQVATMVADGDFDRAHSKLKLALELDPSNKEARSVRETLQEERNKRLLQQAIEELERDGSSKMSNRRFSDALQAFEAALRMKPLDGRLKGLVDEARARMLGSREAGRLLSEAKREAQGERFEEAKGLALKASESDPGNPEAPALLVHLNDAIARIESARHLKAALDAAERLLNDRLYDQAIEALAGLETDFPGLQQIGELQNRIRTRQIEEHRRERLNRLESGLAAIRELQRSEQLAEALEIVESLLADFRGVAAVENLKASIAEEISARQRLQEMSALIQEARDFLWSRRVTEAIALLDSGRKQFPSDAGIERLLEAATAIDHEEDRQRGVLAILESARALRTQGRLDDALELVKSGIRLHGQDVVLSDLTRVIGLDIEDRRSRERLDHYRRNAEEFLGSGSPAEALALLREARSQFPSEPSLELLLGKAEERYARQSEHEIVTSVVKASSERQRAGDLAGAIEEIGRGLRRLPAARDLLQAAASLRERIQSSEREKQVDRFVTEIKETIEAADWARARSAIASGKRDFPDQVIFDDLAAQVQSKQHEAETEKALAGVREHLKTGNLERAAVGLADLEPLYGSDGLWKAEKRNLERHQIYVAELRKAEGFRNGGKYEDAEFILRHLVESDAPDGRAAALLKATALDRASAHRAIGASRIVWPKDELSADRKLPVFTRVNRNESNPRIPAPRVSTPRPPSETPNSRIRGTCPACRVILPEGALFCDHCGKPVN